MATLSRLVLWCEILHTAFAASASLEARRAVRQATLLHQQQLLLQQAPATEANASACDECRRLEKEKEEAKAEESQAEREAEAIKEERDRIAALPELVSNAKKEVKEEREKRQKLEHLLTASVKRSREENQEREAALDKIQANITRQRLLITARAAEESRLIDKAEKAVKDAKEEVECQKKAAEKAQAALESAEQRGRQEQEALDAAKAKEDTAALVAEKKALTEQLDEYKERAEAAEAALQEEYDAHLRSDALENIESEYQDNAEQWKEQAHEEAVQEAHDALRDENSAVHCKCSQQKAVGGPISGGAPLVPAQEVVAPDSVTNTLVSEPLGTEPCSC